MNPYRTLMLFTAPCALAAGLVLMSLSGCTVGPNFQAPPASSSQHYDPAAEQRLGGAANATGTAPIALGQAITGNWWAAFGSATLNQVMTRAINGNLQLLAADATLRQAAASVAAAQGALYPQVDLAADVGREKTHGTPQTSVANAYALGPHVAFDLDVFGADKRQVEQQQAFAQLQQHRYEAAYLTLTGDVASQALLIASANAQQAAVEQVLADDAKNLELVSLGHLNGSATQVDIALAQARLAQDRTLLPAIAQQRDAAQHALSVLTGNGPADWVAPNFALDDFRLPQRVPVSLPSALAHSRPDILQAEAELHMSSAAVGIATANLYPHVELSASLAQAASGYGGAALWGFAAGLTAPIFHGGTLHAERQAAMEGYQAALASYQQTVIASFGQVADTLQAINHDAEQTQAQDDALRAAHTSLDLNQRAYAQGENSLLQVLEAERGYQQALLGQTRARTAQQLDRVRLFIALGGHSVGVASQ